VRSWYRVAVVVTLLFGMVNATRLDTKKDGALRPPSDPFSDSFSDTFEGDGPLPPERDRKASETLRRMESLLSPHAMRFAALEGQEPAGSTSFGSTNSNPNSVNAGGSSKAGVNVVIKNEAGPVPPPANVNAQMISDKWMWALIIIALVIVGLVLLWCFRDIALKPLISCLETTFYWIWIIVSFIPFRLWDGLKICVYPLKESIVSCIESCQRCYHPATKL